MIYYNPIIEFDALFEDILAARSCPRTRTLATSRHPDTYRPRLNLFESNDTVTATFELPGLTSESVAIDVHQNRLTVSSESVVPEPDGERNYIVRERRCGKFLRTLQLPYGTKPEDVSAKMENGILTITFPRTSPEQEAKHVPIH